jgi:carboxymethylenebutenolidase
MIRIQPAQSEVATPAGILRTLEVRLGGLPRGAALVIFDERQMDQEGPRVLNGLAEHGYECLAAEVLPTVANGAATSDHDLMRPVAALLSTLGEWGWALQQVGVLGYGLGGRVALLAAADFEVGAAVSISPTDLSGALSADLPSLAQAARPVRAPWLGLFAEAPEQLSLQAVRELDRMLDTRSPVYTQLVTYPGVSGDFYQNSAESSAHAASFDAWQRTLEWLNLRVVPRPSPYAELWELNKARRPGSTVGATFTTTEGNPDVDLRG